MSQIRAFCTLEGNKIFGLMPYSRLVYLVQGSDRVFRMLKMLTPEITSPTCKLTGAASRNSNIKSRFNEMKNKGSRQIRSKCVRSKWGSSRKRTRHSGMLNFLVLASRRNLKEKINFFELCYLFVGCKSVATLISYSEIFITRATI